jgi:hypothetical protein
VLHVSLVSLFNRLPNLTNIRLDFEQRTRSCLADLQATDPRDDKTRIEQTKGGLLADVYR